MRTELHPLGVRGEQGASVVLIALVMVVLVGLAAVAVDSGIAFEDRRQQQAAADSGALAALQFAKTGLTATHPDCLAGGLSDEEKAACRGAEEVLAVVEGTVPGRYPDVDLSGGPDWDSCVDADKPMEFQSVDSQISDCISFTSNFQRSRVVLPGTDIATAFGRVIGFDSIRVSAMAEAGIDLNQSADVLPFAVGPTGAGANVSCLFAQSTSNLDAYPCNGPDEGNFGKLDIALYGNDTYGTPEICNDANAQLKMATNIVLGADHFIEENFKTPGTVNDFDNCPILTNPVDNVAVQTGNAASGIEDGLWNGISTPSREGRITCKDPLDEGDNVSQTALWPCANVNNQMPEFLDHTPLWYYLTGTNELDPLDACDGVDNRSEMEVCLEAWRDFGPHSSEESLFTAELETAPRFGAVPILEDDPSNGTGTYDVTGFLPMYLETLYLHCSANTCDVVHSPGEASTGPCPGTLTAADSSCGWPSSGNKNVVAVAGFMLRLDMLHPDVREFFPGTQGTASLNLTR